MGFKVFISEEDKLKSPTGDGTVHWVHFSLGQSYLLFSHPHVCWAHWPSPASEPLPRVASTESAQPAHQSPALSSQPPCWCPWAAWASIQPQGFTLRLSWIRLRSLAPLPLARAPAWSACFFYGCWSCVYWNRAVRTSRKMVIKTLPVFKNK